MRTLTQQQTVKGDGYIVTTDVEKLLTVQVTHFRTLS